MKLKPLTVLLHSIMAGLLLVSCQTEKVPWKELITDNGLDDFIQRGGGAIYEIDGESIIGTTIADRENSFLCTRAEPSSYNAP